MEDKIIKIQSQIQQVLNKDNGTTVHFVNKEATMANAGILELLTYNPKTETTFLLHKVGYNPNQKTLPSAYEEMYKYIKNLLACVKNPMMYDEPLEKGSPSIGLPWTVEWKHMGNSLNTSYFHGKDPEEVLSKFYHGKTDVKDKYRIYLIKLNPLT